MITYEVYFNKTYKNSCNLIRKDIKGHYLHIDQVNKVVLIDNIIIAKLEEVNEIRFLVKGYYQNIHIAEPTAKILSTDIPYPMK